jgi:hypothetical protein
VTPRTPPPGRRWQPGQSGNPKGRKPGTGEVARLREVIRARVPELIDKLIESALAGDTQAAKLLIERVIPSAKPAELPAPVEIDGDTLSDQGRAILGAVAAGRLAPGQGAQLMTALGALARVVEVDELEARIRALEEGRES